MKLVLAPESNSDLSNAIEAARRDALFDLLDNVQMKSRDRKSAEQKPENSVPFDANLTLAYQVKLKNKAPRWVASILAGNQREKFRVRSELGNLKDAVPLLMKQRNGGKWTAEERKQLRGVLRSASQVSPYLLIWVIPGSMVLLPLMAWFLDVRRKRRDER
jgi:hypothetical protein